MATARIYFDVEFPDIDLAEYYDEDEDDEDAEVRYMGQLGEAEQTELLAALRRELAKANPSFETRFLCEESFYGMGYSTECTKEYGHEGPHSTMGS